MEPQYPAPGGSVRIAAKSALTDLDAANIAWYVDDVARASGPGLRQIDILAGPLGSETKVEAVVSVEDVEVAVAVAYVRPTEIDLLWQSDSYTPPFFSGKALPSAGTRLRLEAMPRFRLSDGARVPASDLVYTWRRNDYAIENATGRGKSRLTIDVPIFSGTDIISVEARDPRSGLAGFASVPIRTIEPVLVLYEDHPLFGVQYYRSIADLSNIPQVEGSFVAVPYFADAASAIDPALLYQWRVNGTDIPANSALPNQLTINAANSTGFARIELALHSITNFFLGAVESWRIQLQQSVVDPFTQ